MNKKLSARARSAKDAADQTKFLINYFQLVENTDLSLPKKDNTVDEIRYLDSVDGMDCRVKMYQLELEAKRKALSLQHLFTRKEMSLKHFGQLV